MRYRVLVLCALLTACREAPDRFAGPDPFDSIGAGEVGRLTWNVYEDHSPAWNATSDSIYYSARSYPGFPLSRGVLLSIPRATGRAALLLESLQGGTASTPYLAAPALAPNGQSLAFVELTQINDPTLVCTARIECGVAPLPAPPPDTGNANVLLVSAVLRVRPLSGIGSEFSLPISFDGRNGPTDRIAHPFQRQFERDRAEVFRPSWSPDGTRLVFSDGLQLYIWQVGAETATAIPNTADGVWPAWSPAGDVIAFTRLFRNGSASYSCACFNLGGSVPSAVYNRVVYDDGGARVGTLTTIRTDGSDVRALGIGEAPAWTADGDLIFQRNRQLWRARSDGTNATPIPNTEHAFEPAISPNGQWLTFSRDAQQGARPGGNDIKPYDLWVSDF
jgi:hypothetical protein